MFIFVPKTLIIMNKTKVSSDFIQYNQQNQYLCSQIATKKGVRIWN